MAFKPNFEMRQHGDDHVSVHYKDPSGRFRRIADVVVSQADGTATVSPPGKRETGKAEANVSLSESGPGYDVHI